MNSNDTQPENQILKVKLREMSEHIFAIWGIRDAQSNIGGGHVKSDGESIGSSASNTKVNPFLKLLSNIFKRS